MKFTGYTLAIVPLALLATGCGRSGQAGESNAAPYAVVSVRLDTVRIGDIACTVRAAGSTRALRQETVASPVEGQVVRLAVLEGARVQAGDLLAQVETKESIAVRTGAQLFVTRAATDAERARASADLDRVRREATLLDVHAPFDGVVSARAVNEGEYVAAGGSLVTVLDLGSLCFVARLPVRDLGRVRVGQEASIAFDADNAVPVPARVESVVPQVDPQAQTVEVRLRFLDRTPDLRSEAFGFAAIVVERHPNALWVPDAALLRNDETGGHTIVEAVGDTLAVARAVTVQVENPSQVEIIGPGVRAGMHIIVEGHYGLPDSSRIAVRSAAGV